jgi:hypothetical protein
MNRPKPKNTFHQKQMLYFTFVLGAMAILLAVGLVVVLDRSPLSVH